MIFIIRVLFDLEIDLIFRVKKYLQNLSRYLSPVNYRIFASYTDLYILYIKNGFNSKLN